MQHSIGGDLTDEQLCHRAISGDGEAFGVIYDRHVDAVLRHCRRLGSPDAEDMASVTFLEAWRNVRRVNFVDGSARPWLLVVATNVVRNSSRARRRYAQLLSRLPMPDSVGDVADEVVMRIDEIESARRVQAAIAGLRSAEREVIALCDIAEVPYAEAATALGVPVGTVKSRLSRARDRLRRALNEPDAAGAAQHSAAFSQLRGGTP